MFLMAEHFDSHPSLLGVLLATVIEQSAIESLQVVLAKYPIPPSDVAAVKVPDNVYYRTLLTRAFRYEHAQCLMGFDAIASARINLAEEASRDHPGSPAGVLSESIHDWLAEWLFPPVYRVFLLTDDLAAFRRYTAQLDEAVQLPYWQSKDRLRELGQRNPGGILTSMCIIAVGPIMEKASRADPRRNAARLGLALYAYRTRNGKFPAKLDDLVPEFIASVPLNPYDGGPMKMQRTEHDRARHDDLQPRPHQA
jgi:hypothetical protein